MIDCSSDRWAGISIDDASTLHSVACILHFSAVIIVISPGLKCGNATLLVTKLVAIGEAVMKANSTWLLLIRGYNAHFSKWTNMVAHCIPISPSCRHRAASVQFYLPEGWFDMRDPGAVLEHEEQRPHRACDQAQ